MARNGPVDSQMGTDGEPPVPEESFSELCGTLGIRPLGRNPAGRLCFQQERRKGDRGSEPAEAPSKVAPEVEHAEVQSGRGFDEDTSAIGHTRSAGSSPPVPGAPPSYQR